MAEGQEHRARRVRPASPVERAQVVGLVALLGPRFAAIEPDPPGGILSESGALVAGEGFHLKAAALHHSFGSWRSKHDPNCYAINPLYALLTVGMGYLFYPLLLPMRYMSVVCSVGCIGAFYALCRHARGRSESLVCCLLAAAAFDNFAFSRPAFVEPMGTLLGLLALYFRVGWRERCLWAAASCGCAAAAMLTKLNLVYAPAAARLPPPRQSHPTPSSATTSMGATSPSSAWSTNDDIRQPI